MLIKSLNPSVYEVCQIYASILLREFNPFKLSNPIFFGDLEIGYRCRPKIIAEIGINHGGNLDLAKKMAELAIASGADIVKTQFHIPEKEMSASAKSLVPSHCTQSIYQIIEESSLSIDDEFKLMEFIEESGGQYLSTPFSWDAAHILGNEFKVKGFKIGSGEFCNDHILKEASIYQVPLFLSTGMHDLDSCNSTYDLLRSFGCSDIVFLHTTNLYPTPYELVRLGGIAELESLVGQGRVGLSDHTVSNLACLGSIALGSVLLERHFTDDKDREGPDIINSMDPTELTALRRDSEIMFAMRGGTKAHLLQEEDDTRDFALATIVALQDLNKGELISNLNTAPMRPSLGDFPVRRWSDIINKPLLRDISQGEHIMLHHIYD